jgi:hypothetical protein
MPVRHTSLARVSLITGFLSATLKDLGGSLSIAGLTKQGVH